ncbi:hypothetical protein, partial [Persicitalea sp.]|uniref:hypothetical protein n=1 Tax=Persicitalea sp. TaxID=3100273 RepID=UPI0035938A29
MQTHDQASKVVDFNISIANLPNPDGPAGQLYYLQFYGGSDSCRFDTTVVVPYRDCRLACTKPLGGS